MDVIDALYYLICILFKITEIARHANCHEKLPYIIVEFRVRVCRIE